MTRLSPTIALTVLLSMGVLATPACAAAPSGQPGPTRPEIGSTGLAGAYLAARHAAADANNQQILWGTATSIRFLDRALEIDPSNRTIQREAFFAAAQVGDFAYAVPAAQKIMEVSQYALAPLVVALSHYKKGDFEQAAALMEKISSQGQVGFARPMLRAWALAPRGDVDKALSELAPLQSVSGPPDVFNAMSGLLNEYAGRGAQALVNYDALAQRDQLPLAIMRIAANGYMRLGKAEAAKNLIAKYRKTLGSGFASDDYIDALADPRRMPRKVTAQDGMAEALFTAGQMLLQATNTPLSTQLAVVYGQSALYLNPDLSIVRRVMGAALAGRGRYEESNTILAAIKKSEPGYHAAQIQMSANFERLDRPTEALTILQAVAKDEPKWPEVHVAIGDHMRSEQKFAAAADSYDRAIALMPKGEDTWWLYFTRGMMLERIKQFDRAYADFRKAIEINPNNAQVLNWLGYSMLERGINLPEARSLIEKAFKLAPNEGGIIDSMGWAMFLMGETDKAIGHLEKAVEAQAYDPTINEHLGDAYWKVGRRKEAMFQWRRALTLEPEDAQRDGIQGKLTQGLASNEPAKQP